MFQTAQLFEELVEVSGRLSLCPAAQVSGYHQCGVVTAFDLNRFENRRVWHDNAEAAERLFNGGINWNMHTDPSRPLSINGNLRIGGFLTGNQRELTATVSARRGSNFNTSVSWRRSDINLPEGEFVTNLVGTRFNYSFTPLINFQSLIQYNDAANNWAGNFRFGWLNTAGTGLFVVFNNTRALEGLGPINRSFIVKYTRQFDVLR